MGSLNDAVRSIPTRTKEGRARRSPYDHRHPGSHPGDAGAVPAGGPAAAQGYFTPAFYATAIAQMERIHVRRRLKQITNAQGWPVFGNIARVGPDGTPARVFLQEELFGPEEYRQIVAYHYGLARHHLFKAQTYRDHAKARYGLQLPLFSEDDGEVG